MNSKWVVCVILGLFLYLNYKYLNPRFESSLVPTGYNGAHVLSGASLQIKFSSLFTLQRKSCMIPICHEPYLSVIQKIAYNFVKMCWNSFNSRFSRKAKSNCEFCDPPFGFHCVRWCCEVYDPPISVLFMDSIKSSYIFSLCSWIPPHSTLKS